MKDVQFYLAKVVVKQEDEKGKIKKHTEPYLVEAVNPTDVEVIITKEFEASPFEWELNSITVSKIISVLKK